MSLNNRMSEVSQALIVYITEHANCTFQALQAVFCPNATTGKGSVTEQFRARVAYLVSMGHLDLCTVDGQRIYTCSNGMRKVKPPPAPAVHVVATPALQLTPSPCYDRMHAPAYMTDAGPVLRPGALAYKACASRGFSC
jgi:hypothetical protein